MSSISAVLLVFVGLGACSHAEVSCPATAGVSEKLDEPKGWISRGANRQTSFLRVSVLNQKPGGPEYDLAPSSSDQGKGGDVTQVWKLADYRDMPLFLRCHYRNTESFLTIELPPSLQACTFKFRLDSKGNFLGQSLVTCK